MNAARGQGGEVGRNDHAATRALIANAMMTLAIRAALAIWAASAMWAVTAIAADGTVPGAGTATPQAAVPGAAAAAGVGAGAVADEGTNAPVVLSGWRQRVELVAGGGRNTNAFPWVNPLEARLASPFGVDFDAAGRMYLVEMTGHRVRRLELSGELSVVAGTGAKGMGGDDGPALEAAFDGMHNLAMAPDGAVYLSDTWNRRVRRLDPATGRVTTVAGTGEKGFAGDGGPAVSARFGGIYCVSIDPSGRTLYLADLDNRRIRAVDLASGVVRTVAGNGEKGVPADGAIAVEAPLVDPRAAIADREGRIYVLERGGHALRVVERDGRIRTVAGTGEKGNSGDGGPAREARFNGPKHLCLDREGRVLIADTENHVIRRYSPADGRIERVAGRGVAGVRGLGGSPLELELRQPHGVHVRGDGSLFISDSGNHRVLRVTPPGPDPAAGRAGLRAWLDEYLGQPRFAAAQWGVKIVSLRDGAVWYERNAERLARPASNTKLFTAALALDRLGPMERLRTSVLSQSGPDAAGVVSGDLVVVGRGDFSFAARFHGNSHQDNLGSLAAAVAGSGVKRVKGDLVADESYFRGPAQGSGWVWEDLELYYGAEASALTVEDNVVDLVVRPGAAVGDPVRIQTMPATDYLVFSNRAVTTATGTVSRVRFERPLGGNLVHVRGQMPVDATNLFEAVAVSRPAAWFASLFRESLRRRGVIVEGAVRVVDWRARDLEPLAPGAWQELASVSSPPVKDLVTQMMKPSQNLYAQLLLLQVGARAQASGATGAGVGVGAPAGAGAGLSGVEPVIETAAGREGTTEEAGIRVLQEFLRGAGVRPGTVLVEEGSGLSRAGLVTPDAVTRLLIFMDRHPQREAFRASLPVAGVDGTLRRRMRGTWAAGNARAKTGTLRHVYALSGYVPTRTGEELVFSLILNNHAGAERDGRQALDDVVTVLAAWGE